MKNKLLLSSYIEPLPPITFTAQELSNLPMSQPERTDQSSGAKYFGKTSPKELRDLENNAARARPNQLAKAASYLEQAFSGMETAWFGGWAFKLRGSRRETHDLLVLVPSVVEVRTVLAQYSWYVL